MANEAGEGSEGGEGYGGGGPTPGNDDPKPAGALPDQPNVVAPEPVSAVDAASEKPLEGQAREYLGALLKSIGTMLDYANSNGISLPDELREKIGELLKHPAVDAYSTLLFRASQQGGTR
jgi:hypothetical protein